ncbi:hypothetical protein FRC06_005931, partial [Ceratobasidium sp. 370]
MAPHKYQDKRTKLPQALLDQVNARDGDLPSGAPTSRRRTVDRRSARRSKKEEARTRKVQFFSRREEGTRPTPAKKRPTMTEGEDRPAKRPKLRDETGTSLSEQKTSTPASLPLSNPPATSTLPAKLKPKPKPTQTALERLASKRSTPHVLPSKKPRARQKDVEDDEIAWLEAKLGLGGKKKKEKGAYGAAFSADGLDDRLEEDIDGFGESEGDDE